jgi:hypothetical protein
MLSARFSEWQETYAHHTVSAEVFDALESAQTLQSETYRSVTPFRLLWDWHARECLDPRDRLFALYGMMSWESAQLLDYRTYGRIDYSNHFSVIYANLAISAVKSGLCDEILDHTIAFGGLAEQNPSWPSWLPSWNLSRKPRTFMPLKYP